MKSQQSELNSFKETLKKLQKFIQETQEKSISQESELNTLKERVKNKQKYNQKMEVKFPSQEQDLKELKSKFCVLEMNQTDQNLNNQTQGILKKQEIHLSKLEEKFEIILNYLDVKTLK